MRVISAVLLFAFATLAVAQTNPKSEARIAKEVRHELVMLPLLDVQELLTRTDLLPPTPELEEGDT